MPTVLVNDEEVEIPDQPFTCLVHDQDMHVEVPTYVEIDSFSTVKVVKEELTQKSWDHIRTGDTFRLIWHKFFQDVPSLAYSTPEELTKLQRSDVGVQHVAGLIIMACEAIFDNKNVFFKNPETYLHPKVERCIMTGIDMMRKILLGQGIVVAEDERKEDDSTHEIAKLTKDRMDKLRAECADILEKWNNPPEQEDGDADDTS